MAALTVDVEPRTLELAPGQNYSLSVSVANQGEAAGEFSVAVVGLQEQAVHSRPAVVSLDPGEAGGFVVSGALPTTFPPGEHVLGLRVTSTTNPSLGAFREFHLRVPDMNVLRMTLNPATVEAGRAKVKLFLRNAGEVPLDLRIEGRDPEHHLHFRFDPESVTIPAGQDRIVRMRIGGRRKILGSTVRRVFTVTAHGPGRQRQVSGSFIQRAWIPHRIAQILLALIIVGLVALAVPRVVDRIVDDEGPAVTTSTTLSVESGEEDGSLEAGSTDVAP